MNWQILGYPRTKVISRNDSFYSGMAVSLTYQSCKLACPQRLILPLYKAEFFYLIWFISVNSTCKHDYKNNQGYHLNILVTRDKRHYKGSGSGPQKVDQMATGKVYRKFNWKYL